MWQKTMNLQVFSFFISCGVMGTGTLVHSLGSMNLSLMISLMILYKNTKSCRGTHSRKRRGRNCCCKGKAFIWIVQGFWKKNSEMEVVFNRFGCFEMQNAASANQSWASTNHIGRFGGLGVILQRSLVLHPK